MKKIVLVCLLMAVSIDAFGAQAYFTGRMESGQSVTGRFVYNCEYSYAGSYFWRAFESFCPSSIEIY